MVTWHTRESATVLCGAWEPGALLGAVQTPQGKKSLQQLPHWVGTSRVMPTS